MSTNRQVFDEIAESWYRYRHRSRFTSELEEMANRWHGGKLLNIGCAHGADFIPFKDNFELWGLDFSSRMLNLAHKYAAKFGLEVELTLADAVSLPFPDNAFDCAIAIAVNHNINGGEPRQKALRELRRVLKPGTEAFITVWNKWQPRFWLKNKEVNVPWKSGSRTHYRYYYLYSYPELRSVLARAGFQIVNIFPEKSYRFPLKFFSRNICALVKKEVGDA